MATRRDSSGISRSATATSSCSSATDATNGILELVMGVRRSLAIGVLVAVVATGHVLGAQGQSAGTAQGQQGAGSAQAPAAGGTPQGQGGGGRGAGGPHGRGGGGFPGRGP